MKTFRYYRETFIDAEDEEQAKDIFADESWNFASEAECECVDVEQCCECGASVSPGSGKFINRITEANGYISRRYMGRPYPEGAYLCAECDQKTSDD